jgi:hypothetical protein
MCFDRNVCFFFLFLYRATLIIAKTTERTDERVGVRKDEREEEEEEREGGGRKGGGRKGGGRGR